MTLAVDREQPLTALNVAARWPPLALCYLRVHFVNETAVDEGGVFRDFMSLIGECVTNELLIGSGKKGDADDGDGGGGGRGGGDSTTGEVASSSPSSTSSTSIDDPSKKENSGPFAWEVGAKVEYIYLSEEEGALALKYNATIVAVHSFPPAKMRERERRRKRRHQRKGQQQDQKQEHQFSSSSSSTPSSSWHATYDIVCDISPGQTIDDVPRSFLRRRRPVAALFEHVPDGGILPVGGDIDDKEDEKEEDEARQLLFAIGRLAAVAVVRNVPLDVGFSRCLYKLMAGEAIDYADLARIDPDFAKHRVA